MNIETKSVRGEVADYLKFGWKYTEDKKVPGARRLITEHILARDKDMENYRLIAALEAKYFNLKAQLKHYEPADPSMCILLLLLLVLPGIVYAFVKSAQKGNAEKHNAVIQRQMDEVLKEVAALL